MRGQRPSLLRPRGDELHTIQLAVAGQALALVARLAGLRVPSETHTLTWADVDFDRGRLNVHSVKSERFKRRERREVPIVPALATILQDAFAAAAEGAVHVVGLSRSNLRRLVRAVVKGRS